MIHGASYDFSGSWIYLIKKHYCLCCGSVLERKKREVIVNSASEEAKNYDFFCVDSYLKGNIKFVTFYFRCPSCSTIYEVKELKKLEKERKKKEHR